MGTYELTLNGNWGGPEQHKYDGPDFGKGGTGVLSVDGKEVAHEESRTSPRSSRQSTRPSMSVWIAVRAWRTGTTSHPSGKIEKLTVKLVPPNAAEEKLLQQNAQETKNKAQ